MLNFAGTNPIAIDKTRVLCIWNCEYSCLSPCNGSIAYFTFLYSVRTHVLFFRSLFILFNSRRKRKLVSIFTRWFTITFDDVDYDNESQFILPLVNEALSTTIECNEFKHYRRSSFWESRPKSFFGPENFEAVRKLNMQIQHVWTKEDYGY